MPGGVPLPPMMGRRMPPWGGGGGGFVLTRLHLRYGKEGLGEDLVFRQAPPIVGGREFSSDGKKLETGAVQSGMNNFQARYAIRHAWTGPVACENPHRGIWGGPPGGMAKKGTEAAQQLAFAKRGGFDLVAMVARDESETKIDSGPLVPAPAMYQAAVVGGWIECNAAVHACERGRMRGVPRGRDASCRFHSEQPLPQRWAC